VFETGDGADDRERSIQVKRPMSNVVNLYIYTFVELTTVGGRFSKKSGFNITNNCRRPVAAGAPPPPLVGSANSIFYNIDIRDLPMPIRRYSSRLRCRRFSMSDVYIG